jgi:hypothetical protein
MKKYERNTVIIESIKQFGEHDTVDVLFLFLDLIVSFDTVVVLAAELMMNATTTCQNVLALRHGC